MTQPGTGIDDLAIDLELADLDCHRIPSRPGEREPWHLDARSPELRWFMPVELATLDTDDSVRGCSHWRSDPGC